MAIIFSTNVWVPGNVTSSPTPLCKAPEYHHSPGRRLCPLITNYPNEDFFNSVLFSHLLPETWQLKYSWPLVKFLSTTPAGTTNAATLCPFLEVVDTGSGSVFLPKSPAFCYSNTIKVVTHDSVTRRGRGCAVWEYMPATFKKPRDRERSKGKCTWS